MSGCVFDVGCRFIVLQLNFNYYFCLVLTAVAAVAAVDSAGAQDIGSLLARKYLRLQGDNEVLVLSWEWRLKGVWVLSLTC